jgi:hypothetical protein
MSSCPEEFSLVTFKLTKEQAQKAYDFMHAYSSHDTAKTHYGFGASPECFEGAGCATLTEAIMNTASLKDFYAQCSRVLTVSKELFGSANKQVALQKLLTAKKFSRKATSDDLDITLPDPDLLQQKMQRFFYSKEQTFSHWRCSKKKYFGNTTTPHLFFES